MYKIIMPSGGQTTDESVICGWRKKVGDKIELGDVLFEIETDKTILEVESYCKGYLRAVKYGGGETVPVGETVAYIGEIDEPIPDENGNGDNVVEVNPAQQPAEANPVTAREKSDRIMASPLAKKIAREYNADLKEIASATNIDIIKKRDVLNYISKPTKEQNADNFSYIPYYTVSVDVDMTSCVLFLKRLNEYLNGEKEITVSDMIIKCAGKASKKFPSVKSINISDLGMYDVDNFTSVIKQPESCFLSVGAIREKAVSVNREIVSRDMMDITASFDYRVTDSETGAQFLAEVRKLLESPELFILMMAV